MSELACTFIPEKTGKNLMNTLKKQFGYEVARTAMLKGALNPKFINNYRHSLALDAEGVPTFESFIAIPYVQDKFIGKSTLLNSLNKDRVSLDDTMENYESLLQEAFSFNTNSPYRDGYVAQVTYTGDNKIKVEVSYRTDEKLKAFQHEYRQNQLNKKLADIFAPLGVTVGELSKVEVKSGRVGVTDFTIADRLAQDFTSMIRVANNREGAKAVSEEFSHLIIGVMRDNPLISRSIAYIQSNPEIAKGILGEDYEDVVAAYNNDMSLVAEEALGHILKNNLIDNTSSETLFNRTIKNVQQQFKDYKEDDVTRAINEVNQAMSEIAKGIFENSLPITKERIANSKRQVQLNALSDRIQRNLDILKKARDTEVKRYKISKDANIKEFAEANIEIIDSAKATELDSMAALCKYAQSAVEEMKSCFAKLTSISSLPQDQAFSTLRYVRGFIASYSNFIEQVYESINLDREDEDSLVSENIPEAVNLKDLIDTLVAQSRELTTLYSTKAHRTFCDFLQPYLGDNVILKMKGAKGTQITVDELLHTADKDISFFDRWLDSMGDSADVLLQIFDQVVKQTKDNARLAIIESIREIASLREEAEKAGITSFDWMFETDATGKKSGDYIREVNYAEFDRQLMEFDNYLIKKYGKNPKAEKATARIAEKKAWLQENAQSTFGKPVPKEGLAKWRNSDYMALSDTQKNILKKFIAIKENLEKSFPDSKADTYRAIQIRKEFAQRLIDSGASPSTIFANLKNYYAEAFLDRIDDDQIFGMSQRGGLKDFEDHEYMTVPILYTSRLENPNDLSTDVFSTLMQYAYMAHNYEAMDSVVDALETGRSLVRNNRKVKQTRGDFPVIEKAKTAVGRYTNNVFVDKSYIEQKLDDFFESQVYGRYLKDSGAFTVFGKSVNKNKLASFLLGRSSLAQLGFNYLANLANILTGSCMQHIEAVASEYFNVKELAAADLEYNKLLVEFIPELGSRMKQSKLALFDELINFKGDFRERVGKVQKKNVLQRIFGENIAFMGQDGGDHWLYNRTAIAMAKRQQVVVPGKGQMSLWDALKIVDSEKGEGLKKMILPKGTTDVNGKVFNISKWGRQVLHVNQSLFGIYNEEDSNAANRVIMGRLIQQYRKWIKPQYNKRFQAAQQNLTMDGKIEEGYYRTLLRILNELVRSKVQLSSLKDELTDSEKANIKRAVFELAQFAAVWALANLLEFPDDKDRPWALKLAEYSSRRLAHELGGLAPTLTIVDEMLKNLKNPLPSIGFIQDTENLVGSLVDPRDWCDELQSGPYKGMSTLEKNVLKSPFWGIRQFRQVKKFTDDIETSILYYTRPY